MSQQKGMSFKELRLQFQTEEACEAYLLSNVGRKDVSARSAEGPTVIGFTDVGNMSVSSAIVKAQSQRAPSCTVRIFR